MSDTRIPQGDLASIMATGTDVVALLNHYRGGFDKLIGLEFTRVTADEVEAKVPVTEALLQPYGLVHGGVYASIAESVASAAAAISVMSKGLTTVGAENSTAFLRGTRSGTLIGTARPLSRGSRTQVWVVEIRDDQGREVANSRVRVLCLDRAARVGGEEVVIKSGE